MAIWVSACVSKHNVKYAIEDLVLVAEGPLFEGANTAQATYRLDPKKLKSVLGAYPGQIVSARLLSA